MSSSQTIIEHVVLFKVKDDVEPSDANQMVSRINGLISIDEVLHIAAGPILRVRSTSLSFTHFLHSRYKSKDDLASYVVHPSHVSVVKENAALVDDAMAVDWVADELRGPLTVPPGSAVRVTFWKLKQESLCEESRSEIMEAIRGVKEKLGVVNQFTYGENFSPNRAKGFSIAFLAVFPSLSELDSAYSNLDEKFKDYLDSFLVLDYAVPSQQSVSC